jgi:hypothetical protein
MSLFRLGRCVATPGALRFCDANGIDLLRLLTRHASGDWGDVDAEDREANNASVRDGSRILSSYAFPAGRVWIITEAQDDNGVRASTCVLLPHEY